MKRRVQCVEQQESPSNITKYCPLPRNREFKIWPRNMSIASAKRETIWRYSEENPRRVRPWTGDSRPPVRRAYSNQCNFTKYCACQEKWHCNFTNSVPASKSCTPASLQLHQICSCRGNLHCNFTNYCACHEQQDSSIIATSPNICTCHEKLHCNFIKFSPCHKKFHSNITATSPNSHHEKWHALFDPYYTWNVQVNALSIKSHPPTCAPAAIFQDLIAKSVNCFRQKEDESKLPEHYPRTICGGSGHETVISRPPVPRAYLCHFGDTFRTEEHNISCSGYLPKFRRILCLPRKLTLLNIAPAAKSHTAPHQIRRLPQIVTLQHHCNFKKCACHATSRSNINAIWPNADCKSQTHETSLFFLTLLYSSLSFSILLFSLPLP